ncbi:MAG: class I SAM-dependent methyltransferase [Candidatus Nealsonbacteria bacterium]
MRERMVYATRYLLDLFLEIEENPYNRETWRRVVEEARSEDWKNSSLFHGIPSAEIIEIGERIRATKDFNEKFRILSEKCSTSELWYDIILEENQIGIKALEMKIGQRKWPIALDVGCGTGNSTRPIARYCESIHGLDASSFILKVAKDHPRFPNNMDLITGNAMNLPFSDDTFDLVYSNGLSGHLTEQELIKFYQEATRILKGGGKYFEVLREREEKRVPTNGKALLAYLINIMVTGKDKERPLTPIFEATFLKEKFEFLVYKVEIDYCHKNTLKSQMPIPYFSLSKPDLPKRIVLEFRKNENS